MTEFKEVTETLTKVLGKKGRTAGHLGFIDAYQGWVFMQNTAVSTSQETLGAIYRKLKEMNRDKV